eukprot:CAMPEP_0206495294 /NCGR_PEP_ID=MMETSP0324_2-20121206/48384_1 /ASSEMBLY_ACC=CAM_ASM_000836 /TAXON_ID=2866 /ORGANISM="Crypthecodinium cohnii, Strain Seligo" /LENGTH=317 /DNA_ID=CAMNT_0053979405 /DNA_START=36 /DNA_END=986 /DNA_ORIENTATION=+
MASAPGMASMAAKPSKEQCRQFLKMGIAAMQSSATREILKDPAIKRPGDELKKIQRQGWDQLGFDQDIGCQALEKIEENDHDLMEVKQEFMVASMTAYLQSLEDRKPPTLENSKRLPREVAVEFFDACNVKMQFPPFQAELVAHVQQHSEPPGPKIIAAQREILELLGYEADHGCRELERLPKDNPDDQDLQRQFQQWAYVAQSTGTQIASMVMRAKMNPELVRRIEKARSEVGQMSQKEQADHLTRMQKKWEIFSKLPSADQAAYMDKQSEDQKMDLIKTQVLLTHARMAAHHHAQHQHMAAGPGGTAGGGGGGGG